MVASESCGTEVNQATMWQGGWSLFIHVQTHTLAITLQLPLH